MEEPGQPPLKKKKKKTTTTTTNKGVAVERKDGVNEQEDDKKQQGNGEEVNSSEAKSAAKTSGKTDVRFDRFKLFGKVMQKSLEKYVEIASLDRFSKLFHPLYEKNPQRLKNIHEQFIGELRKGVQEDIQMLIEEGRLNHKLNELDKLERSAMNNPNSAWRPSGTPEQDFCSFLMPYYNKQEAYMKRELKKIKTENAALAQRVQAGRENIALTEQQVSTAVNEWKMTVQEFDKQASSLCPNDVFNI